MVPAFENSEWDQLLDRIGVDPMLHLLMDTSIFIPLPNGCLCQVTGEPIVFLTPVERRISSEILVHRDSGVKRPRPHSPQDERPAKRRKLQINGKPGARRGQDIYIQKSPANLVLARSRLFFARPCHIPHTNFVVVGLPPKHALNCLYPSYSSKSSGTQAQLQYVPKKQTEEARHLSKYIFPAQYGMQSPFQYVSARKGDQYPNYLDREKDIEMLGRCKTPKRLKEVLPLLDKLIWRHKKCDYKALRNIACPSKIKEEGEKLEESVILVCVPPLAHLTDVSIDVFKEMMSEQSIQLDTQAPLRLDDISMDSAGNPIQPLGATQAMKYVQSKPKFTEFECSYYEVFRYVVLVTNTIIPKSFWGSKKNHTLVMRNVRKFIEARRFESFSIHFLLQGFSTADCEWLMPPGEKAKAQGRVCVSDSLKRRELLEEFMFWYFDGFLMPLLKTTFYITDSSAYKNRILYFRQDNWQTLCAPLLNRLLENMFVKIPDAEVEALERQRKLGFSFVRLLPKDTGVRPIVNLRGSRQTQSDEYRIRHHGRTQYSAGASKHSYKREAGPQGEDFHFLKHASDLAKELYNTIFVGIVRRSEESSASRDAILALLREHITENVVRIGRHYYRQQVGIPQGSILSTVLCSFFYGDLETGDERLRQLRTDPGSVLFRLVDDYLFISTSLSKARLFLDMMNQGHPEYGCFIGKDKTLTNFDHGAQIMNVVEPSSKYFPWCGHLINMQDLSVTVDYSRYAACDISNTLTVDRGRKPGTAFLTKMLLLSRSRCHVIYLDTGLNSETVVYLNIYQNMLLSALRMQEYLSEAKFLLHRNAAFVYKTIQKIAQLSYRSIQSQLKRKAKLNNGQPVPCDIKKPAALWLAYHAFHHVFAKKTQLYGKILPLLERDLNRVQNRGYRRRFKFLPREGQSAFDMS
ncbi:hypothetical protein EST38_g7715 [Candolleomyces aberdarensis]|uniref:Telomerase reverse transcriptase n=1 Tax=Candolleomyces aberdarensis TaxID=2316362 RepID=A0A4Q2DGL0_9AGAR|nr:hypothetical protein EST38_g7715 [Candolleomyces aberdarensis]